MHRPPAGLLALRVFFALGAVIASVLRPLDSCPLNAWTIMLKSS